MAEFDQLQKIWKLQKPVQHLPEADKQLRAARTTKDKLVRQASTSCLIFLAACIYIMVLQQRLVLSETARYAVFGMALACLGQAIVQAFFWRALTVINELASPVVHAQAWEHYYRLRNKVLRITAPIYFILINVTLSVFFIDVLTSYTVWQQVLFVVAYTSWVLVSWFIIRKKMLHKEYLGIEQTISSLKTIAAHLQSEANPEA